MGIIKNVKKSISETYLRADETLGGFLPGGYQKPSEKTTVGYSSTTPSKSTSTTIAQTGKAPVWFSNQRNSISGGSGGGYFVIPGAAAKQQAILEAARRQQGRQLVPFSREAYAKQQAMRFYNSAQRQRFSQQEAQRRSILAYQRSIQTRRGQGVSYQSPEVRTQKKYIPFISEYAELGEKLRESKQRKDRIMGQKILTEPVLGASKFVTRVGELYDLPAGLLTLIKNPSNIKNIPAGIKTDFKDTVQLMRTSPSEGVAKIGADIFTFKIIGGSIKATGQVTSRVATRLSPKFVGVAKTGANLNVKGAGSGRIIKINVVGSLPKESFAAQIKRAGTRVNAISSQADSLVGLIRRRKLIMKPLGTAEKRLSSYNKKLLKKFDRGKISSRELIKLDRAIKKTGSKGILERSFFADPSTRIRPSRLGILKTTKDATLRELFSGKATLKSYKPQILLFENVKISKFPKSLKYISNKLKRGRTLTSSEARKLLEWQQTKTGKFKPLGFVSRESEITLAPNEIIKRVKKVGVTEINGQRVPIISTKVIKPTKFTRRLINKARSGKANIRDINRLKRALKRETGFDYSNSYLKSSKPYYPLKRKILSGSLSSVGRYTKKYSPKYSPTSSKVRYTSSGKPYVITSSGARFISYPPKSPTYSPPRYPPKYPTKYPPSGSSYKPPRYPGKPPVVPPKYPPRQRPRFAERVKTITKKKAIPTFNVYGKSGKKFVKLSKYPLERNDALSRGAYAIDNTTSKQFKIIPSGKRKQVGKLMKSESGYFNRAGYKLREYRVKRGRMFGVKPRYIEKTRYGIDTRGEKKGLSIARYLRQQRSPIQTRRINISPSRRKQLLSNLKKARVVRFNNLRKKR